MSGVVLYEQADLYCRHCRTHSARAVEIITAGEVVGTVTVCRTCRDRRTGLYRDLEAQR